MEGRAELAIALDALSRGDDPPALARAAEILRSEALRPGGYARFQLDRDGWVVR